MEVLEKSPNLKKLFNLCEHRPNLVVAIVKSIKQELSSKLIQSHAFKESLQNGLDSKTAQAVLTKAFGHLNDTYGFERWHSLFRPRKRDDEQTAISLRPSFQFVTARIMNRLALDAITGRVIESLDVKVFSSPEIEAKYGADCFPTYIACKESGIFAFDSSKRVQIPYMVLMLMHSMVRISQTTCLHSHSI